MAYITLNELKEVLPIILERWIDEDDESWEWIFQEIEQKCHIGTKRKGKKWKKYVEDDIYQMKSMADTHSVVLNAHRNDINELTKKVDELKKYATDNLSPRINRIDNDVAAAKSMAQTAKQRTEVDYTQMSKVKNDTDVIQDVYNRMAGRGATKEELDTFRNLMHKYDALEKKDIPVWKQTCETCKHSENVGGCALGDTCKYYSDWEAKENG